MTLLARLTLLIVSKKVAMCLDGEGSFGTVCTNAPLAKSLAKRVSSVHEYGELVTKTIQTCPHPFLFVKMDSTNEHEAYHVQPPEPNQGMGSFRREDFFLRSVFWLVWGLSRTDTNQNYAKDRAKCWRWACFAYEYTWRRRLT